MNKNPERGSLAIIFLFVVLLVGVGAGAYYYGKGNLKLPVSKRLVLPSVQVSPTPTLAADETANWKTYTSEALGFSLQYPGNWGIQGPTKEDPTVYIKSNEWIGEGVEPIQYYIYFYEHKNPDNLPLQKLLKKQLRDAYVAHDDEFVKEQIGEYVVYKVNGVQPSLAGAFDIFIADKKQTRYISFVFSPYSSKEPYESQDKYFQVFEQILSTFKFTN